MKSKRVWRYYCEFCKKANCSKPSIAKHESGCTLNPKRICKVCGLMEQTQPTLQALFDSLPTRLINVPSDEEGMRFTHTLAQDEMKRLRDAAGNCPACIMAALRQKDIPVPCAYEFDFEAEMDAIWNDFWTEKNAENEMY